MDVQSIFVAGGTTIKNPSYTKKNGQPEYITVSDLNNPVTPTGSLTANLAYNAAAQGNQDIIGRNGELDKYYEMGLTPNEHNLVSLDKAIADTQSTFSKWKNSLAQTVVSEIGLGTLRGISDLVDMVGQATGISDPDYSNPVSAFLEQKQEEFRNWAPVYADPDKNITNGGLLDAGWWASNMPSVASSLTLLIPSTGVVKGLSMLGRAAKVGSFTSKAIRTISRAEKAIEEGKDLNRVQRFLNSSSTANATKLFLENGTTAALSRAMENYQEARQTYSDMYANASDTLHNMSPEEYNEFLKRNKAFLKDTNVDLNDRDEVAKTIAKTSADKTFALDWINVVFDVIQLYALRNAWKGLKNAPSSSAGLRKANRDAAKYIGKTEEEIAKIKASQSFGSKALEYTKDKIVGGGLTIGAELSEGVEEAVNYIAQQEGIHLGNTLLGTEKNSTWDKRMSQYITAPELWDSAFWGVMGGVVFQGLGSTFKRVANKLTTPKSEANNESQESLPWYALDDLPEIKRRKAEIEARNIDFNQYKEHLAKIEQGIDIYKSSNGNEIKFETEEAKQYAKEKLKKEYIAKMTLRAMNTGNLNMFKAYLSDDNVRKGMIEAGLFNDKDGNTPNDVEAQSRAYISNALHIVDQVEKMYDEELVAINSISANLNAKLVRRRNKNKDENGNTEIPAEYMQIMAVNNVKAKLQLENLNGELAVTNTRLAELETTLTNDGKLDPNIDHRHNVKLAVLINKLGQLHAYRRAIATDKEKSLSNRIALSNIDKQIKAIEDKLEDPADLAYATFVALQYKRNEDGTISRSDDANDVADAYAYRDQIIVNKLGRQNIPGLEYLSDRHRIEIDNAISGKYQTLEQDAAETYTTLSKISPELNNLYQIQTLLEQEIDNTKLSIARTIDEVAEEAGVLHNTMNEARNTAINNANKIIQELYKKYRQEVRSAIDDIYHNYTDDFELDTPSMSTAERQQLKDAVEVLALSKSYNQSIIARIEEQFAMQDAINAQQEVQNEDDINNSENSISATENGTVDNSSTTNNEASRNNENGQNDDVSSSIDPQNIENRIPTFYTKFYKDGKVIQSGRHSKEDNGGVAVYDNNDDSFTIDARNNATYLNNPEFFETAGEVDLTRPFKVEVKPIAKRNKKGKLVIIQRGRVVNTDTIDYQETEIKEEKQQESETQQTEASKTQQEQHNPSTGEVESTLGTSSETVTPAQTEISTTSDEVVFNQVPADDTIKNEALGKILKEVKQNHDIDIIELAKNITNDYVAKGVDRELAEKAVNWAVSVVKRKLDSRKQATENNNITMRSSIDEVLCTQSSLIEISKNNTFTDTYINAVKEMINTYVKEQSIKIINGKTYINLEALLRYCNNVTNDSSIASLIYNNLKEYLKSDEAKQTFITTDESLDSNDFLDNVQKSAKERYQEKLDATIQRVDIKSFIIRNQDNDELINKFYDALDDLQPGQNLKFKVVGNLIRVLDEKDRIVGTMPIPKVDKHTGAYIMSNDGWITDVLLEGDHVTSRLKNLFKQWIDYNNPIGEEINDIIFELAYSKPTEERKLELLDKFAHNLDIIAAKESGFIDKDASDKQLINGLVKLWRFVKPFDTVDTELTRDYIDESLESWFKKLNNSYDAASAISHGVSFNCTVAEISDGELIRVQDVVTDKHDLPIASDAIANGVDPKVDKIAVADARNQGFINISGSQSVRFNNVGKGNTFVMIPNRSGRPGYVHAYPCDVSDEVIGKDAKDIVNAVMTEAKVIFKTYADDNNETSYNNLKNFLVTALSSQQGNNSLFRGVTVTVKEISGNEAISIAIPGTSKVIQLYKYNKQGGYSSLAGVKDGDKFKYYPFDDKNTIRSFNEILNNLQFNMSYAYIASDSVSDMNLKGFAKKRNGKFIITIKDKTWTYDSFNDFVLKNDLVRLNTKPAEDGKSNYNRRALRNQRGNQVFKIKLAKATETNIDTTDNTTTTSPVKEVNNSNIESALSITQKTEVILNDKTNDNKGLDIVKLLGYSDDTLKAFENLHLLPNHIIFDENFNSKEGYENINAEINTATGVVTVGTKWKALFENPNTRDQAIRKLIHEELHHKLRRKKGYLRSAQAILDEFKEALNEGINNEWFNSFCKTNNLTKEEAIDYFKQYLFENENADVAIEEFLVESLTSSDLANLLNSIDAKDYEAKKGAKNLFQKILELMAQVFNWNIREGSLYEKELKTLREDFKKGAVKETKVNDNTTETEDNNDKQTKNNPTNSTSNIQNSGKFSNDISNDMLDLFDSSVIEVNKVDDNIVCKSVSVSTFKQGLPLPQQAKFGSLVLSAELSVSCR